MKKKVNLKSPLKYVLAITKAVIVNILFMILMGLTFILYKVINEGIWISTAYRELNGPLFYFNSIILFLTFCTYFLYRAECEF